MIIATVIARMRRTTLVLVCLAVVSLIAAIAVFFTARPATAPSVKVMLVAYMNDGTNRGMAEFEVLNNGSQTVRLRHGISIERPENTGPMIGLPVAGQMPKPLSLRPGERKRFCAQFYVFPSSRAIYDVLPAPGLVKSRFRGACWVTLDGPRERMSEWFPNQKWFMDLPIVRRKTSAYRFASAWHDD